MVGTPPGKVASFVRGSPIIFFGFPPMVFLDFLLGMIFKAKYHIFTLVLFGSFGWGVLEEIESFPTSHAKWQTVK